MYVLPFFSPVANALKLIMAKYFQIWSSFGEMVDENTFPFFSIELHSFPSNIKKTINGFFRDVYDCPSFGTQETFLFQNYQGIFWLYFFSFFAAIQLSTGHLMNVTAAILKIRP